MISDFEFSSRYKILSEKKTWFRERGIWSVSEGIEVKTERKVHLREIRKKVLSDSSIDILKKETHILKNLKHPNLFNVFGLEETFEKFFQIRERIEGISLSDKVENEGTYTERQGSQIIWQLIQVLEYLHSFFINIIELKIEYIMSIGEGEEEVLKLVDIGFSSEMEESVLPRSKYILVSPESLISDSETKSDLWCLGTVIYFILSGERPFYHSDWNFPKVFRRILIGDFKFVSPVWFDISSHGKELIKGLMTVETNSRWTLEDCKKSQWFQNFYPVRRVIKYNNLLPYSQSKRIS